MTSLKRRMGFALFAALVLFFTVAARAQYHSYNVPSASDCILQDYRSPNVPGGIYDAIHEEYHSSSDGGSGYFYGGFTHQNNINGNLSTLVQFVCWPARGSYPVSYAQQIPFYTGTNMAPNIQIGEGSSCSIKGYWPQFITNLWTREAVRYWLPGDGTPHVSYQGMWMKEPVSGNWYHLATFKYPFAVTGVDGMSGWQENFTGYTGDYKVAHAGGYYHKNGVWQRANQINFTSGGYTYATNDATYATSFTESDCGPSFTGLYNNPHTLTLTDQPALPTFDPIVLSSTNASVYGSQLLVQWQLPLSSSPQLSYKVEVFTNASYTGTIVATAFDNDPEARQDLLNIGSVATPYVRLTISDIFYQTNVYTIAPTTPALSPAANIVGTVAGLAFQYYEAPSGNWTALPNFAALSPVYSGAVSSMDTSARRRRVNYGFTYSGYITAPADGLYAFTMHSGDGSKLVVDGTTVINFDGLHDSSQFKSGGIALAAGKHTFAVQFFKGAAHPVNTTAYTDGLGLTYEGPGLAAVEIPASAYSRVPAGGEPTITMTTPTNNATVPNTSPGLSAAVVTNGVAVNSVRYYLTDFYSYYLRPSQGADYYLGQGTTSSNAFNTMIWTAATNLVRARLVYNGTNMIDSAPVSIATTNSSYGAWYWNPLEMHNYPSGASIQNNTFTILGDGMNFLSRKVTGDCTFIARLASITPNVTGLEGVGPGTDWRAGIILRSTTNTVVGQPLGDGSGTRFVALFGSVGGGTYFEDDTMRNGNGDANRWSGNLGGANDWFKLQRVGDTFTSYVSADGVIWTQVNSTNLSGFATTMYAGVFTHAVQSFNPNIHKASFDSFSLTGAGVVGPASVSVSPLTNAVIGGLSATFAASVIGPVPPGYQWKLNGTNILDATNSTYTVASATTNDVGSYTVVANSVTSAPAFLLISMPAGSGVWTNLNGGSWATNNNWSGGLIAGGTDAVADFSTLSLAANRTVTLDGARTVGALIFDDLNPTEHNWTLNTGSGGPLTLAVSGGTPNIASKNGTNTIAAVVAGTQGFTKSGGGYLTLSGSGTFTGDVLVNAGTLEVAAKSGDTTYSVSQGATLRLGYGTGGGYANTGLIINGDGASATTGLYLKGGTSFNVSGGLVLQAEPTTIRQYGSGLVNMNIFDINSNPGLSTSADASGSVVDANIQMVNGGYGMVITTAAGANTAAGDLTLNGPLNVGSLGFYKRGGGSLRLNGAASAGNTALRIDGGTVICGAANCIGANAALKVSAGTTLNFNGFSQTVVSNNSTAGISTSLAGSLKMTINKGGAPVSSVLTVTGGGIIYGGTLAVTSIGAAPAAGDTFTLFSAPSYSGSFTGITLPTLSVGLIWNTNSLSVNGTISVAASASNAWSGSGADGNWNTALNWTNGLPANGDLLTFQGTLRQNNTNNLLTSVGQVIFTNGGFALRGNPLTLQWGFINLAGVNTNAIITTLTAPQSFVCSNGTFINSASVTNGGFDLTLDGTGSNLLSAAVTGSGELVKNGAGTSAISAQQTYTGGTVINAGTLNLTGGGGSSGVIRGTATVNAGGTLQISTSDATGYGGGASCLTVLNLVGGTLNVGSTANQTLGSAVINMTGGAITGSSSGNIDFYGGVSALNTLPSATTATISGVPLSPLRQGSTTFAVAAGTTASGIDLDISSILRTSPSGDAAGAVLTKSGAGTMRLNATNTFARAVSVGGGTLLVNGSLASGSPVTVSPGATLGGTGVLNGAVTNTGALAPGNLGIGRLTVSNAVNLSGGMVLMELSKSGSNKTNDLLFTSTALSYTGSLVVTNLGPDLLAAGDSFKLFNATGYGGGFTNYVLPALATNLVWDTSGLAVNGTLAVAAMVVITNPPQSVTTNAGNTVAFSVLAGGTAPLGYKWRFNGTNIAAATLATLTLNNVQLTNAGNYTVIVTNNYSSVTSAVAVLTVNIPPAITNPPQSLSTYVNSNAIFSVAASGTPAPAYQWRFNGTNLSGATATNYIVAAAQATNEGAYTVVVSNGGGSVTSSVANLTLYREYGRAPAPYPSLAADNGARHLVVPRFQLGQSNVISADARTNSLGDDGVQFATVMQPGRPATVKVVATAAGYLNGWIDYSANKTWTNAGEQAFTNLAVVAGTNTLNFTVPTTAAVTTNTWARFRFSAETNLATTGQSGSGEVEDYLVTIAGFTLTYSAGANGAITGATNQTVNYAASGTAVTATPDAGYHFVNWSDGGTANPRTDTGVTNNLTVTANFAINTYTLTYNAGANGTLAGSTNQAVNYGANGTVVTALPNSGYAFTNWSDGLLLNPRTELNVTNNLSVTAHFIPTVNTTPTNIVAIVSGSTLIVSWPADRIGWQLQSQANALNVGLNTNWSPWPGSTTTNQVSVPIHAANPGVFLRLIYPPAN